MTPITLCAHLRWKRHETERLDQLALAEAFMANQVPYSCLRTCRQWGPDDLPASPELCQRSRPCFAPDPSTPMV